MSISSLRGQTPYFESWGIILHELVSKISLYFSSLSPLPFPFSRKINKIIYFNSFFSTFVSCLKGGKLQNSNDSRINGSSLVYGLVSKGKDGTRSHPTQQMKQQTK